jgi:hypothetical protein
LIRNARHLKGQNDTGVRLAARARLLGSRTSRGKHRTDFAEAPQVTDVLLCACLFKLMTRHRHVEKQSSEKKREGSPPPAKKARKTKNVMPTKKAKGVWSKTKFKQKGFANEGLPVASRALWATLEFLPVELRDMVHMLSNGDVLVKCGLHPSRFRQEVESVPSCPCSVELPERKCTCLWPRPKAIQRYCECGQEGGSELCTCAESRASDLFVVCGCDQRCDVLGGPGDSLRARHHMRWAETLVRMRHWMRSHSIVGRRWRLKKKTMHVRTRAALRWAQDRYQQVLLKLKAILGGRKDKWNRLKLAASTGPASRARHWFRVLTDLAVGSQGRIPLPAPPPEVPDDVWGLRPVQAQQEPAAPLPPHCRCYAAARKCKACSCKKAGRSCNAHCHLGEPVDWCCNTAPAAAAAP